MQLPSESTDLMYRLSDNLILLEFLVIKVVLLAEIKGTMNLQKTGVIVRPEGKVEVVTKPHLSRFGKLLVILLILTAAFSFETTMDEMAVK